MLDAFHAELLGCAAGLQEAARMGIAHLHIEMDATLVKAALESDDHRLSAVGGIITEINLLLATEFPSCNVISVFVIAFVMEWHTLWPLMLVIFSVGIWLLGRVYLVRLRLR